MLGPGFAYIVVLFIIPLVLILSLAFFQRGRFGGVIYEATLAYFQRAIEPVYVQVLIDSLVIAGFTTLVALLVGYPTAWSHRSGDRTSRGRCASATVSRPASPG